MRLLWICNVSPSVVYENITGKSHGGGLWLDSVLDGLRKRNFIIRLMFPGSGECGFLDESCDYISFKEGLPYQYSEELKCQFVKVIYDYAPDVIHVWGTEYGHSLALVNAAVAAGYLDRVVVSIQGLCSVIANHYCEGLPINVVKRKSFRDFVRRDNILQQQHKFFLRGNLEIRALQKVKHVIGRTEWDYACSKQINPCINYHFCNETLRAPFYEGKWSYRECQKYQIFASSCAYPVKGFHYLVAAFAEVQKFYPEASLVVPGKSPLRYEGMGDILRRGTYAKYIAGLIHQYRIEGNIGFLGDLSAEQMKMAYLKSNVFVLPSTIENSPNSLGEAMLLGVPCVASDVGGVSSMFEHNCDGYLYQSTAPYMLAHYIKKIFEMGEGAEVMGTQMKSKACKIYDSDLNLRKLIDIYIQVSN